ncbi:MAG: hypothetical protein ACFFCF_11770 [Promethearchaeota archaeon]
MTSEPSYSADTTNSTPTRFNTKKLVHLWSPHIDHTPITNMSQLHNILHTEYPALTHHPVFPKLLEDAERHLAITQRLDKPHLQHGDIADLARTLGVTRTIIYRHVRQALKPRLYWYIDNAIPKTQAHHQLAQIHETNTHIHALTDLNKRLTTYYPTQYLENAVGQPDRLTQCQKYFHILTLLAEGGHSYTTLAQQVNKTVTNIKEWCINTTRPGLINLARRIPATPPKPGNQWLPLTMQGRFHPTHFIQVPTQITDWTHIPPVLQQLTPLTNNHMTKWRQYYGPIPQTDAFAYLLGNLVSDAGKITPHYTSTRLELNLTKNYTWSQQLGDAVCYYLGLIGIHAEAKKPGKDKHRWRSQNSPLLTWIKHVCLGLEPQQLTTYTPIVAPWILKAPRLIRIRFLQGLNDGDGHVLLGHLQLGNACEVNAYFYANLLSTFSIHSLKNKQRVIIENMDGIVHATELPFFLHAIDRQEKANKAATMVVNRFLHSKGPVPKQVVSDVQEYHRQGKSTGEIIETVFDKHNICYYPKRIRNIIQNKYI